ncbi:hypothetical protein M405DRAFT_881769 [Rhizopogon salebrosus TDB-379]|nr:hypothetical protein M405DRAFT_881769 [Rhizopogon salebrosus TDB-379]
MDFSIVVGSQELEKFFRIASISIAIYDFILTLPAEYRFYRRQSSIFRLQLNCVLFILIRYVSILVMVVSNYGALSTSFTQETCQHYYVMAPIFKVVQTMISQVILGVRTFNITLNNRRVGIALVALYFVSISLEWFTNMFHRIPVSVNVRCTPGNTGKVLSAYLFYVAAMSYDFVTLTISTVYLLRYNPLNKRLGRLLRSLVYEGLGYFIVLAGKYTFLWLNTTLSDVPSGVNVFNTIYYHTNNVQNQAEGASIGYVVTWFMSQRLLIHRVGRDTEPEPESRALDNVVFAHPARPVRKVISALHSQFDSKHPADTELASTLPYIAQNAGVELDTRACIERSAVATYMNEPDYMSAWGNRRNHECS